MSLFPRLQFFRSTLLSGAFSVLLFSPFSSPRFFSSGGGLSQSCEFISALAVFLQFLTFRSIFGTFILSCSLLVCSFFAIPHSPEHFRCFYSLLFSPRLQLFCNTSLSGAFSVLLFSPRFFSSGGAYSKSVILSPRLIFFCSSSLSGEFSVLLFSSAFDTYCRTYFQFLFFSAVLCTSCPKLYLTNC